MRLFIGIGVCLGAFLVSAFLADKNKVAAGLPILDRVVVAAPIQVLLFGGDRFLPANLETMRAAATGIDAGSVDVGYMLRSQTVVSELNPCQEDNAYLANAFLAWGGAEHYASRILSRATDCRFWDEFPPFFDGFNQYFFFKDYEGARRRLELAASRSKANSIVFRKLAVMVKTESIPDERLAYEYLVHERDQANDSAFRTILDRRVLRLNGLVVLRDARRAYEARYGNKLTDPGKLLELGLLDKFPLDPTNIGYEFVNNDFRLREVRVQ